jgi:septal ring factor EnvC (AmiA/AmiB activator)
LFLQTEAEREGDRVKSWTRVLAAVVGIAAIGIAAGEHRFRREAQRLYREAVDSRRQLERRVSQAISSHEQLERDLAGERERSQALSSELGSVRGQLENAVGQLASENRTGQELRSRLAALEQQLDQLQGELAMTLQERERLAKELGSTQPVQLERILVSNAASSDRQGRVVSVHGAWDFVVTNLGWDEVQVGDTVSIFRDDRLQARARIDRVQEGASAATVLPEWKSSEVQVNDIVRPL